LEVLFVLGMTDWPFRRMRDRSVATLGSAVAYGCISPWSQH